VLPGVTVLVRKVWQRDRFTAKKVLLKGTAIAEKGVADNRQGRRAKKLMTAD